MHDHHHNWIDGAPVPAVSGDTFEVRIDGSRAAIGRWPRSGAADLGAALDSAQRAAAELQFLGTSGRRALLSDAIDELLDEPDPAGLIARTLGLSADESEVHIEPLEWALDDVLDGRDRELGRTAGSARHGPLLLLCDWSEMWLQPARTIFGALLAGRAVIVVSDSEAPMIADALAHALRGLPAGAFAVLHDDGRTLMRAAAEERRIGSILVPSTSASAAEVVARASAAPPSGAVHEFGAEDGVGAAVAFGADIERPNAPIVSVRRLAGATLVVRADADLEQQARVLVWRSFSRSWALSGARPGRAARALIPVRAFSRFSEHLLEALESDAGVKRPLGIVRALLAPEVERASRLGHDEGATAIFDGTQKSQLGFPLVFTNVEERMRLAQLERPAPILCLMRARDAQHARALAERLDGE